MQGKRLLERFRLRKKKLADNEQSRVGKENLTPEKCKISSICRPCIALVKDEILHPLSFDSTLPPTVSTATNLSDQQAERVQRNLFVESKRHRLVFEFLSRKTEFGCLQAQRKKTQ